jgi:tetratricopeptide (TPR) repeat protein
VTAFFALGLMAKPTPVTLPLVLLLLDFWPLGRLGRNAILEKLPWLGLSAISCLITIAAQGSANAVWQQLPFSARAANAIVSYAVYMFRFVWPTNLAAFYPYSHDLSPSLIAACAVILIAVTIAAALCRDRCPALFVGWLWYLGMLVPVIGLVQVGAQARADRYCYLSEIGLAIAAAWGLETLARALRWRGAIAAALATIVLAALTFQACLQASCWKDSIALWQHAIACTSRNSLAHNSLGRALAEKGDIPAAMAQFQDAVSIDPDDDYAHSNLGLSHYSRGEYDAAIVEFREALRIKRDDFLTHYNLGVVLMQKGDLRGAADEFRETLRLKPEYTQAAQNLEALGAKRL